MYIFSSKILWPLNGSVLYDGMYLSTLVDRKIHITFV